MAGSNIFVVYADGKGNVTLSARHGTGHDEPEHDLRANVTLLEGSGVANGRMVANVLCTNCARWQGGTSDFSGKGDDWIWAAKTGSALNSNSMSAAIEQHSAMGSFTWDYSKAQGGNSTNPFLARLATSNQGASGNNGVSQAPSSQGAASGSSGSSYGGNSADGGSDQARLDRIMTAHGVLAAVAFLVLFPLGALLIRIPGVSVWVHAGMQSFAYCCFIAAAGLGIYFATTEDGLLTQAHPIIGMVLLGVLAFQPLGGLLHHRAYKAKPGRTAVSHAHIWLGRAAVLLGIINGGLGIQLAGDVGRGYTIAYGIVAGVMGTAFLGIMVWGEMQSRRRSGSARKNTGKEERNTTNSD